MKRLMVFLLISFGFQSFGQANLDSLYAVWEDEYQLDSTRVSAFFDYIRKGFLYSRPDTVEELTKALHAYSKERNYPKASAFGFKIQGIMNAMQGNYSSAIDYFNRSLLIEEEIGDEYAIASTLGNIGNVYYYQSNYTKALEYHHKSLKIDKDRGDKNGIASSLYNIGLIYDDQGNYPRALDYYQRSMVNYEELGNERGISACLGSIGNIYQYQGDYLSALGFYQKSLKIEEGIGDQTSISVSLNNIGTVYFKEGNYSLALEYYRRSLTIDEEIGDKNGMATCLNNIGSIYENKGDYPRALQYHQKALVIQQDIGGSNGIAYSLGLIGSNFQILGKNGLALDNCKKGLLLAKNIGALDIQKINCECLYDAYKALGNSKKALDYYEYLIKVKDSLFNEANTEELTRLEMQYEFDKKEAVSKANQEKKDELAAQEFKKQRLERNGFMAGFGVVFVFAVVFFQQRKKISKEKDRSENLLHNILPEEVAAELKDKGTSEAKDFDEVTVLFTDFVEFTQTAEKLSAKELVQEINTCFKAFDGIMEKYQLEKIKTIGDAYMAAGGLHVPKISEPKDLVQASLEMQNFMLERKASRSSQNLPAFDMRVGIHTGPVVAGIVGVKKFQYDIWGDTVNTASRMESHGEIGRVNISNDTYQLINKDSEFSFESRGKVEVKGKGEMEMWFVKSIDMG